MHDCISHFIAKTSLLLTIRLKKMHLENSLTKKDSKRINLPIKTSMCIVASILLKFKIRKVRFVKSFKDWEE